MALLDLLVGGEPLDPALQGALTSVTVRQALAAPAQTILVFADFPAAADRFPIGTAFEVRCGDDCLLIAAEVVAVEHRLAQRQARSVIVRGYDRLHRLRKRQRVRAMENTTLDRLLSEAAEDLGVQAAMVGDGGTVPVTIQHDQNDWELLARAAANRGRYLRLMDGTLSAIGLDGDGRPARRLRWADQLLEAAVELNAETMRSATVARGWSLADNAVHERRAGLASQDAIEFRAVGLEAFPGLGERTLVNRLCTDDHDALAQAQADLDRASAAGAVLTGLALGDGELAPGRTVALEGVHPTVDGDFILTEVSHEFGTDTGYLCRFSSAPPVAPAKSAVACATLGVVMDTNDPEQRGRVRLRLPAIGSINSGWLPVLVMGAGDHKGAAFLPEVDDEVLALLVDGDPGNAVVLGGLWGRQHAPLDLQPPGARDMVIRSPAGQTLSLDGRRSRLSAATRGGDHFELGEDGSRLTATRDLIIEAPGHAIRIRAARVDFERA